MLVLHLGPRRAAGDGVQPERSTARRPAPACRRRRRRGPEPPSRKRYVDPRRVTVQSPFSLGARAETTVSSGPSALLLRDDEVLAGAVEEVAARGRSPGSAAAAHGTAGPCSRANPSPARATQRSGARGLQAVAAAGHRVAVLRHGRPRPARPTAAPASGEGSGALPRRPWPRRPPPGSGSSGPRVSAVSPSPVVREIGVLRRRVVVVVGVAVEQVSGRLSLAVTGGSTCGSASAAAACGSRRPRRRAAS